MNIKQLNTFIASVNSTKSIGAILKLYFNIAQCKGSKAQPHTAAQLLDHMSIMETIVVMFVINEQSESFMSFDDFKRTLLLLLNMLYIETLASETSANEK